MLLTENARGVYIISATPFADDGALDLDSAARLTDFYAEAGVDGITILGMMGEAPKLTGDESRAFAKEVIGRTDLPVIVGVSGAGFDTMGALARDVMAFGAAGVMVAPPSTIKNEVQLISYFTEVAGAVGSSTPLVYQDFPLSTQVHISVACFNRLVDALPQLVMLKHEDWPGLRKISQIRRSAEADGRRRISILVGNGGLFLPQELARGADGAMTGFAYPEMLVEVCRLFAAGRADEAEDLFDIYLPLVRYEQQPGFGLAPRKEILRRRGIISSAKTRAPGPAMDKDDHAELTRMITRLESRLAGRSAHV